MKSVIHSRCPQCGVEIEVPAEESGAGIQCASCGHLIADPAVEFSTFTAAPEAETDKGPGRSETSISPTVEGETIGDYTVYEELGRGGMGVVYRARQRSVNRQVALKLIRSDRLDEFDARARRDAIARFETEALAAARLEHESIVTVYEVGEADGRHYYSMQYVDGSSLRSLLQDGRLDNRRAAEFMRAVAEAVHQAHRRGILHRDLKPHNILVESQSNRPLVADFGLAKLVEGGSEMTVTGEVFGTPQYMSPEQARDSASVTVSSDIYSLGATLYHLLTGRPPFSGSTTDVLRKLAEESPTPPSRVHDDVDRDLEMICLKCLEKNPDDRYVTAAEAADELGRYLKGEPVQARPVSRAVRLARWAKRNPVTALLTTAVLLLVGFAVGTLLQNATVRKHRDDAVTAESEARLARDEAVDAESKASLARDAALKAEKAAATARDAAAADRDLARQAENQKKTLLADSYATSGELAMSRGQTQKAIDFFDKAIAEGNPEPIALRLRKVDALVSLSRFEQAYSEIDALGKLELSKRQRGEVSMWRAEFAMGPRPAAGDAEKLLRSALNEELGEADRLYVEGMLSKTSPAAIEKFQAALQKQPFHHRAFGALVMMQITLGRLEDALSGVRSGRKIFPTDRTLVLLESVIFALRADRAAALAALSEAPISDSERKGFVALIDFVIGISKDLRVIDGPQSMQNHYQRGWLLLVQNRTVIPVLKTGVHFPPVIAKTVDGFPFKMLAARFGKTKPLDDLLENLGKVHPEGLIIAMQGHKHSRLKMFAQAIPYYQKALTCGFVIPSAKAEVRNVLTFSLVAEAMFGLKGKPHPPKEKMRLMKLAVEQIRQIEPNPNLTGYYLIAICKALEETKEHDLLRVWLDTWGKQAPDDVGRIGWKLKLEMQTRNYRSALELANRLLKSNPEHPQAKPARAKILAELRRISESGSATKLKLPAKARRPSSSR